MKTFRCEGNCKRELPVSDFGPRPTKLGHNRKCRKCVAEYYREYFRSKPEQYEKHKKYVASNDVEYKRIRYRHGLTEETFLELFTKYNGLCWSCQFNKATVIDHDHSCCPHTYSCGDCIRGALCHSCNTGIGLLGDSIDKLNRAVLYLTTTTKK